MKILHTADNHFEEGKLEEATRCFGDIIKTAKSEKPNLVVIAGDLFDRNMLIDSPAYHTVIDLMFELTEIAPIILIPGNHDPENSLEIFSSLNTTEPIYYLDKIKLWTIKDKYNTKIEVVTVPYRKKSDFDLPDGTTIQEADKHVSTEIVKMFEELPDKKTDFRIFVGHFACYESSLANRQTISGNEPVFTVEELLKAKADVYFLGHIHNHEQKIFDGYPIRYSGPHYSTNFGETQELGFWIWEDGEFFWHKTSAKRSLNIKMDERLVLEFIKTGKVLMQIPREKNLLVKIKASVPEALSSQFDLKKLEEIIGARVEKVIIPKSTTRSANISNLTSLTEKFKEWASVKNIEVTDSMLAILEELEQQTNL